MSLFSVLSTGTRGLSASQLAMNIVGQNISNADVEGYSRKRLNLSADYRYDPFHGQIGTGVEVINIERYRNEYIDQQIRKQNQMLGMYEETDYTLQSIENIFVEPSETGILHFVDQFFDSWQNLANNPSDPSARTMVKTNGEILLDVFHNAAYQLQDLRQTRNDEIHNRVNSVNQIIKEIHNLNTEIGSVEIGNQNANDSRDKRDQLLKDLSQIIGIETIENELGQITVTTGGNILVSPVNYQELETTTTTFKLADGTTQMDIGIRFSSSKRVYTPSGGQLRGLIESRDKIIPHYQTQLDTLAISIVETVNDQHKEGYNLNGFSGIAFFDELVTGASDINLSAAIRTDIQNIATASGNQIHPAAQNSLPASSHDFGIDPIQLYTDPSATPLVNAKNIVQGTVLVSTTSNALIEGVDYHVDYANGTIQMLHDGYDSEDLTVNFQYRTGGFAGPGDNSNALEIAKLRDKLIMNPDVLGNGSSTFAEYYGAMIGELGLSRNEASSNLETRTFLVDQYEAQQDSISGVSLDEEMANLIKYQHTYQAAARLITTTNSMLDVLLNM
ncbi:MAG: flagellar hook-associated protein FlgK [Fibrobacter sp.]|nr:flagellar hook-associated protein FlgK [Fibrobacter sp.]